MIYNNFWYTNFVADSPGVMEFQFDLAWRKKLNAAEADQIAESMTLEPIQLVNPAAKEQPAYIERLYQP